MTSRSIWCLVAVLMVYPAGQAHAAGVCAEALTGLRNSSSPAAEDRPFPIVCNWNLMFALEDKMLRLGDLKQRRTPKQYDDQISVAAVKRAQKRVGLPETGIVDSTLFISYMALP